MIPFSGVYFANPLAISSDSSTHLSFSRWLYE